MLYHIRGKTDTVERYYQQIKLIEHLPTAIYAALDGGMPDNRPILVRTFAPMIQPQGIIELDNSEMHDEIKIEDLEEVPRSHLPSRELTGVIQAGLDIRHNAIQTTTPPKNVKTINVIITYKRDEVENKYAGLFNKLMGVNIDNDSLRDEVRKLTENEVRVLPAAIKTKLWNFGIYHDAPHLKPWIKMDEDLAELSVQTTKDHEPEGRWTDMSHIARKLYKYASIDSTNHLCKKLGILSKIATEAADKLKKGTESADEYNGCAMDAAEEIMQA